MAYIPSGSAEWINQISTSQITSFQPAAYSSPPQIFLAPPKIGRSRLFPSLLGLGRLLSISPSNVSVRLRSFIQKNEMPTFLIIVLHNTAQGTLKISY